VEELKAEKEAEVLKVTEDMAAKTSELESLLEKERLERADAIKVACETMAADLKTARETNDEFLAAQRDLQSQVDNEKERSAMALQEKETLVLSAKESEEKFNNLQKKYELLMADSEEEKQRLLNDMALTEKKVKAALAEEHLKLTEAAVLEATEKVQEEAEAELEKALMQASRELNAANVDFAKKLRRQKLELENTQAVALEELEEANATEMAQAVATVEAKRARDVASLEKKLSELQSALDDTHKRKTEAEAEKRRLAKALEDKSRKFDRDLANQAEELQLQHRAELEEALLKAKWGVSNSQVGASRAPQSASDLEEIRSELRALQASSAIERRQLQVENSELQAGLDRERDRVETLSARLGIMTCEPQIVERSLRNCFTTVSTHLGGAVEHLVNVVPGQVNDLAIRTQQSLNIGSSA